jgi:hypothetical protein
MTQGAMKVHKYARYFIRMMRYVPKEAGTEEKKLWFHRGLNHEIRIILTGAGHSSHMSMVNRALEAEKEISRQVESLVTKHRRAHHQSHIDLYHKPADGKAIHAEARSSHKDQVSATYNPK